MGINEAFVRAYFKVQSDKQENSNDFNFKQQKYDEKWKLNRNSFPVTGKFEMPIIKNENISLEEVDLMCFTKVKNEDYENIHKTVHFFTHDWLFDSVYDNAEKAVSKLKQYYALLTPDFSMYFDMPLALQIYSTFKNRWCGAYWQSLGLKVIPTIEWGDERSFEFCFDGIEQGGTVAVSTYCRRDKEGFLKGYNKMLEVIKPKVIICYGEPFPAMQGNIKVIPLDIFAEKYESEQK